jgi:hypothetical protein
MAKEYDEGFMNVVSKPRDGMRNSSVPERIIGGSSNTVATQ